MKKCLFCGPESRRDVLAENEHFFCSFDKYPVTRGHVLVISKRHVESFFDLTGDEITAFYGLLKKSKKALDEKFRPDGYNVGVNIGKAAGQSIPHLHVHLIPRYRGDAPEPIGGVRCVIPGKGNYLKNPKK